MAYHFTRDEAQALADIVEYCVASDERTAVESSALDKLHKIVEAIDIVQSRKRSA